MAFYLVLCCIRRKAPEEDSVGGSFHWVSFVYDTIICYQYIIIDDTVSGADFDIRDQR